jgi:hypothetical protein
VATENGMGSGIIIDKSGYIVTNNHVIEGNSKISVILNNGKEYTASILAKDEITDLAVLRISAENLPVALMGDSDKLKLTEDVLAIGYPLDMEGSATISRGIVSALLSEDGVKYIQTDAAINPGTSGGALINLYGEVTGINVFGHKITGVAPIEGINYALAINSAKASILKLMAGESILIPRLTYTDNEFGYTIQYPKTWTLSKYANGVWLFINPDSAAVYIVPSAVAKGDSLSLWVDNEISDLSRNSDVYEVLSRVTFLWQGIYPTYQWEALYRKTADDPLVKFKRVSIINNSELVSNGYLYDLIGTAYSSEYETYSLTIDSILSSFRILGRPNPA